MWQVRNINWTELWHHIWIFFPHVTSFAVSLIWEYISKIGCTWKGLMVYLKHSSPLHFQLCDRSNLVGPEPRCHCGEHPETPGGGGRESSSWWHTTQPVWDTQGEEVCECVCVSTVLQSNGTNTRTQSSTFYLSKCLGFYLILSFCSLLSFL